MYKVQICHGYDLFPQKAIGSLNRNKQLDLQHRITRTDGLASLRFNS